MLHTLLKLALALASLLTVSTASAPSSSWAPYRDVARFPNTTFVENIAVRPNGDLLVSIIFRPELYSIDPRTSTATLVANLTDSTVHGSPNSFLGIAQTSPDVFAILTGHLDPATFAFTPGRSALWRVDLSSHPQQQQRPGGSSTPARVSLIAAIPPAAALNGLTTLPNNPSVVLASDCYQGRVYRIDTRTGKYRAVLSDEVLTPAGGNPNSPIERLGINGVRSQRGYLYFANSSRRTFGRVRLNPDGTAAAPFEILANVGGFPDDFALDEEGNAYIAREGTIRFVSADGRRQKLVVGSVNSTAVAGATSAVFGRGRESRILYVTTSGGLSQPTNGTYIEGGKVVRVDLTNFRG